MTPHLWRVVIGTAALGVLAGWRGGAWELFVYVVAAGWAWRAGWRASARRPR